MLPCLKRGKSDGSDYTPINIDWSFISIQLINYTKMRLKRKFWWNILRCRLWFLDCSWYWYSSKPRCYSGRFIGHNGIGSTNPKQTRAGYIHAVFEFCQICFGWMKQNYAELNYICLSKSGMSTLLVIMSHHAWNFISSELYTLWYSIAHLNFDTIDIFDFQVM